MNLSGMSPARAPACGRAETEDVTTIASPISDAANAADMQKDILTSETVICLLVGTAHDSLLQRVSRALELHPAELWIAILRCASGFLVWSHLGWNNVAAHEHPVNYTPGSRLGAALKLRHALYHVTRLIITISRNRNFLRR